MCEASLGAVNAASLPQHPLFRPGVFPPSPFLGPLHAGMFPWAQPHPLHTVLQQSIGSADHLAASTLDGTHDNVQVWYQLALSRSQSWHSLWVVWGFLSFRLVCLWSEVFFQSIGLVCQ